MNFKETVDYLSSAEQYGIVPGLDSIKRLCRKLGDPQDTLNIIHIAGTNGKGSAGAFLDSILRQAGYKTGRYLSPAVMDYLEKIQYCGRNITEKEYSETVSKVKKAADEIVSEGFPHPTVFELETAAAFCFFAARDCDLVLIEAGMGGRTDATNVISSSELSIITSISLEHTKFLGSTIEQIAAEKGGIIKQSGSVLTLMQNQAVTGVLTDICKKQNADLTITMIYNISDYSFSGSAQTFTYQDLKDLKIHLLGKFQTENAALAVDACRILNDKGYVITENSIRKGLEAARWPGRFEVIRESSPMFIIDGAHNVSAAKRLRETIDICFTERHITYIMGTFKDKEYSEIARYTTKRADMIYTVSTEGKRGLDAEKLAEAVKPYNSNVKAVSSVEEAVSKCFEDNCDIVIAFGSLSFLRKVKDCVNGAKDK
ncbi:MAG: bifunctional folylpolyglutamate synthase/dihydrofolate synthase [Oscillospiraceae bacterium]|nr:bifunctional folylpolyglutamate synthase/dihydrofolate synthase [Oscillospiraceae bacterium]MBR3536288.1 bifunctional folylpolyglutamate synthase/dihydrofolate synthase [Oscillospiraceae bacterium]MBR6834665.1 bifunctional folylpolyglutamate synthase/dihydrofolate synthase [Oscillospiraceae bacterium]